MSAQEAEPGPDERYEDLVDELVGLLGVTPPNGRGGFGRSAVRFQGKIFVMLVRGRLVLKLPARRVDELVEARHGVRFDANKGTPMREWLSLDPESDLEWLPLAMQALDFARPGDVWDLRLIRGQAGMRPLTPQRVQHRPRRYPCAKRSTGSSRPR